MGYEKSCSGAKLKKRHIDICIQEKVESKYITNGFEQYSLVHRALPEINLEDIKFTCKFLGHSLGYPLIISPMTGGTPIAEKINKNLAKAAQSYNIAMVLGSAKEMIKNPRSANTYAVRDVAPDIFLMANLGAVDLNRELDVVKCRQAVEEIGADGLVLYLNPLQECFQNGNPKFQGLLGRIEKIVTALKYPVIVKEVGQGISGEVALQLEEIGVAAVDVAGAGGTSWSIIEKKLSNAKSRLKDPFDDWGIPTAEAIRSVRRKTPELPIIASGGIRNGLEIVKAISLGANLAGMALPLLSAALDSADEVKRVLEDRIREMRIAMFCSGAKNIEQLSSLQVVCKKCLCELDEKKVCCEI